MEWRVAGGFAPLQKKSIREWGTIGMEMMAFPPSL
jgi:hypothetical protein